MALYLGSSGKNDFIRSEVTRPTTKWHNTALALRRVENLLHCSMCKGVLKNPYTYSTCYHHFCQGCIKAECGLVCPACGIPIWSKDLLPNFQLANVIMLLQHMKSLIVEDSVIEVKQEYVRNVDDDDVVHVDRSEHTVLTQDNVTLNEPKENAKGFDTTSTVTLPLKNTSIENEDLDEIKKSSHISVSKIKNPNEVSQPRTKRRRVLCSAVHNSHHPTKELDIKSPFSPIYKRTRSFHKKTLPTSNLTIQKKSQSSGKDEIQEHDNQENLEIVGPGCVNISRKLKTPKRINHKGETMLHVLAIKGDANSIDKLLQDGDDPNVKDYAGWTPLHEACNHGHHAVANVLLSSGALVNIPGYANCTPLHDAVVNGHLDIVKLLIAKGADPCIRNKYGKHPEDLTDDVEMKQTLQLCNKVDLHPQILKSPHASPILNGGPSKVVLLGTSLKGSQKSHLLHAAKMFNARVSDSFNSDVTHLVTSVEKNGCCPRTLKYLYAVAAAKWIVSFDWIADSLSKKEWADETLHEVKGCTTSTETICSEAPRKSRENFAKGAPGIFDGCRFYFYGSFVPPKASKEELTYLVTLADANVIHREPKAEDIERNELLQWPYHFKGKHWISNVFIVYDPSSNNVPVVSEPNARTVAASWILDCLSYFELNI